MGGRVRSNLGAATLHLLRQHRHQHAPAARGLLVRLAQALLHLSATAVVRHHRSPQACPSPRSVLPQRRVIHHRHRHRHAQDVYLARGVLMMHTISRAGARRGLWASADASQKFSRPQTMTQSARALAAIAPYPCQRWMKMAVWTAPGSLNPASAATSRSPWVSTFSQSRAVQAAITTRSELARAATGACMLAGRADSWAREPSCGPCQCAAVVVLARWRTQRTFYMNLRL